MTRQKYTSSNTSRMNQNLDFILLFSINVKKQKKNIKLEKKKKKVTKLEKTKTNISDQVENYILISY